MPPAMTVTVSSLSGYGKVRRQQVSVPHVEALRDDPRYTTCAAANAATREITSTPPRQPRAPTLRKLVKLALQADTAEQLGTLLRQRYAQRARGLTDAEVDRQIAALEKQLIEDR